MMGVLDFLKGTRVATIQLHQYPLSRALYLEGDLPAGDLLMRLFLHYFDKTVVNVLEPHSTMMVDLLDEIAAHTRIAIVDTSPGEAPALCGPLALTDLHVAAEVPVISVINLFERNGNYQCYTDWRPALTHPHTAQALALGAVSLLDACVLHGDSEVRRLLPKLAHEQIRLYRTVGMPSILTLGKAPSAVMLAHKGGQL